MASNRELLFAVCQQLEPILDQLVLVGGCSMDLLLTDQAVTAPRTTQDVDMVVKVLSRTDYYAMEDQLRQLGFSQAMNEDVICRWRSGWKVVDLMPDNADVLGFSNSWYGYAMKTADIARMNDLSIRYNNAAAFLACKLEAFAGRGQADFRSSHDFEDIVTLLDGRADIVQAVSQADNDVQHFISQRFSVFIHNRLLAEYIAGHLAPDDISQQRLPEVLDRFSLIAHLNADRL